MSAKRVVRFVIRLAPLVLFSIAGSFTQHYAVSEAQKPPGFAARCNRLQINTGQPVRRPWKDYRASGASATVARDRCIRTCAETPRRYPTQVLPLALPALFIALGVFASSYLAVWVRSLARSGSRLPIPTPLILLTGFVTNFFDTLGIGSFATTTSIFKFTRMVPDRLIPGTLNAGHTLPVIFQAFIYIAVIEVDVTTLLLMIAGAVVGAWFGAGWVAGLPKRGVQIGVAVALLVAFVVLLMR